MVKKSKKSLKKKVVRNFLKKMKFDFFEFFSENVFKTLLRVRETTRKKYRILFEKYVFLVKKSKKSSKKKKVVRKNLKNLKFFIFFEIFSENVLITLLGGRETSKKKY